MNDVFIEDTESRIELGTVVTSNKVNKITFTTHMAATKHVHILRISTVFLASVHVHF